MELPSKETLLKMYRQLVTARRGEQRMFEIMGGHGPVLGHRGPGEEAVPIGICANLTETDCFAPNFRTRFCLFAKPGFTLKDVVAMTLEKAHTPYPVDTPKFGTFGRSGTLGELSVIAAGTAVSNVIQKTGDVTVFIQGDGAANRAPTHEAMAVAGAWNLPIIFVIQNNQYGMGTAVEKAYNIKDLSVRGLGYGFPSEQVDGNDVIAMYLVAKKHLEHARNGGGPSLIAANTYRFRGHYEQDAQAYRPDGEQEEWQKTKDPIPRYEKQLMDLGLLTKDDIKRIAKEIDAEIEEAIKAVEGEPTLADAKPNWDLVIDGV